MIQVAITVNGKVRKAHVEPRTLLVHFLREHLNLTGTHVGCDTSQCGACTVFVDGRSAKSCTIFAVQADGSSVTTIEGLAPEGQLHPLQQGFWDEHGLQCGYCTPGMIMSAVNLLQDNPSPSEQRNTRRHLRQLLPLHRLSAHRQRHPARRETRRQAGEVAMTTATPVLPKLVGERVKRREDPRLIQGRGTYVDDLKVTGMRHMAFKRSDIAHGKITAIDTSAAEKMDGVEAVYTGADIAKVLGADADRHAVPVAAAPCGGGRRGPLRGRTGRRRGCLGSLRGARRGRCDRRARTIRCRSWSIPKRRWTGSPTVIHKDFPNNLAVALVPSGTGVAPDFSTIDNTAVDKAFADAEVVISQRMVNHRLVPNAMEPRGVLAHWEPGKETMTIWSSTQNPHILKTMIAAMNGLGQHQVRAIAPEVGGGFGAKINIYAEEYVCSVVSKQLGMPIKWIEDRSEAFVATTHGRDILGYIDIAARKDGKVLGLKMRLIADIGAYNMLLTAAIPTLTMLMANGTYDIPAIRTTLTEVFTNKTPTDAYRGAGRPEATYFVERAMDMLARELNMDPG